MQIKCKHITLLDVNSSQAGVFVSVLINPLKLTQFDLYDKIGSHISSSELYFYDTAYTHDKHLPL